MVAVSHEKRFIFVKTRKTAGTSVEMLLERHCVPPGTPITEASEERISSHGIVGQRLSKGAPGTIWHAHMPLREIARALGRETFDSYARIMTVRDPWDRAISAFWYMHARKGLAPPATVSEARARMAEMLESRGPRRGERQRAFFAGHFAIDHVLRYEHLAEDFDRMARALSLDVSSADLPMTKNTRSTRPDWPVEDYFDAGARQRIREVDGWMFDRFGYVPDPGGALLPA